MELFLTITAGAAVGFAIGVTGVGGGSLMTPILLAFGYPAPVAIGTDLLYAAITKAGGAYAHYQSGNVDWDIVRRLALGSVPTALLIHTVIHQSSFQETPGFEKLLTFSLGIMLIATANLMIFRYILKSEAIKAEPSIHPGFIQRHQPGVTYVMGVVLGICVTLSSVGAGAFAAAILLTIYAKTRTVQIIGSDIAHAVPLTFIAGLGYLFSGYVDLMLLASLLIGSLPAIALGSRVSSRVDEKLLQSMLILILMGLGCYYTLLI